MYAYVSFIVDVKKHQRCVPKANEFRCLSNGSPRFLCRPTTLYIIARAVGAQYIRKTADLLLQLWVSTFPRFVAIGFNFLSETLI